MSIDVIIPWRTDNMHRERTYRFNMARWRELGIDPLVYEDDHPSGPFNKARLVNEAVSMSNADVVLIWDADIVPDLDRVYSAMLSHVPWLSPFSETWHIGASQSEAVLRGAVEPASAIPSLRIPMCMGLIAVNRHVFNEVGGMDERFEGWGSEDLAFRLALQTFYPHTETVDGPAIHLWHPKAPRDREEANGRLAEGYRAAVDNPKAMKELLDQKVTVD